MREASSYSWAPDPIELNLVESRRVVGSNPIWGADFPSSQWVLQNFISYVYHSHIRSLGGRSAASQRLVCFKVTARSSYGLLSVVI